MSGSTCLVFIFIKATFEAPKQLFHSQANIKVEIGPEVNLVDLFVYLYSHTACYQGYSLLGGLQSQSVRH